jgi:hypothetical protein
MEYEGQLYRADVTDEVCAMYGVSDMEAYEDEEHDCMRIMLGWQEIYSTQLPWDDVAREDVRRHAYAYKNDTDEEEIRRVSDFHDRLEARQLQEQEDMNRDFVDEVMSRVWHGRIAGVIHPGRVNDDSSTT